MKIDKFNEAITFASNFTWSSSDLPSGNINMRNAPFFLESDEEGDLLGMSVAPTDLNEATSRDVYCDIRDTREVHFLLNAAFGLRVNPTTKDEWEGRTIGSIALVDDEGSSIETPLVLGGNIRDWYPVNFPHSVFKLDDPDATSAWSSNQSGASIDMLKLGLPNDFTLRRISIQAKLGSVKFIEPATLSEIRAELVENVLPAKNKKKPKTEYEAQLVREKVETSYPRIQIFGITCKVQKPPKIKLGGMPTFEKDIQVDLSDLIAHGFQELER